MKLKVTQACEQGTKRGVMRFHKGEYPVKETEDGCVVTHDPRPGNGATQTTVPRSVVDKMVACGVASLEE